MKMIGRFLLAVVLAVGFAGCGSHDSAVADPIGTWILTYDWGCDGNPAATVLHITEDQTWADAEKGVGDWVMAGDTFIKWSANRTYFTGTLTNNDSMSGTMTGEIQRDGKRATGCWSAILFSKTP